MPDRRMHRGPHPDDLRLFESECWPQLRAAIDDLTWLLDHGYAMTSSLKLVGDRYNLQARQRIAVERCVAATAALANRRSRELVPGAVASKTLWVDGYNVLTTVEAALAHGVLLLARDGCFRDMASMHGSYRKVAETRPALERIGRTLATLQVSRCRWLLDRPVSNSGRLKTILNEVATAHGWSWEVELVQNPDPVLIAADAIVVSADSVILDHCGPWFNLAREVLNGMSDFLLFDSRPTPHQPA